MPSIMQDWATALPLRHQGVLVSSVRGCDNMPKESSGKPIGRALRGDFLVPVDDRVLAVKGTFMQRGVEREQVTRFLKDLDHHPLHYITHLMHACQVVGYKHPDPATARFWLELYRSIVRAIHLEPESEADMDARLTKPFVHPVTGAISA